MWHRDRSARNALDKLLTDTPVATTPPKAAPVVAAELKPEPVAIVATPAPPVTKGAPAPTVLASVAPKQSVLGPTLRFKGDLVADEDLIVQGKIEGSILHSRSLTVGQDGSMLGDIRARRVIVEGQVEGDLYALEAVNIKATAQVTGSLFAPRVGLMDGAVFNGIIDMQHAPAVPQAVVPPVSAPAPDQEMTSAEVDEVLTASTGTDF